jgi:hypothetical protein
LIGVPGSAFHVFTVMDDIRAESPIPFEPSGRMAD